jgi:hypothetical protein
MKAVNRFYSAGIGSGGPVSVTNPAGEKIVLYRLPTNFLDLANDYGAQDPARWRSLACLVLHARGFSMRQIGLVFSCNKSTVCRTLEKIVSELNDRYAPPPVESGSGPEYPDCILQASSADSPAADRHDGWPV